MIEKVKKISVVVPVFNEIDNIEKFHEALTTVLHKNKEPYEIIYVDDNSTDGTFEYLGGLKSQKSQMRQMGISPLSPVSPVSPFAPSEEVRVLRKVGKKGKAFSLHEGFAAATGSVLVMIDGDLQYPPEKIPEMIKQLEKSDVVVAERENYKDSITRQLLSKTFRFAFGRMLFGLSTDIQSGLKVFKREVYETVAVIPTSPWTFDLEFLYKAKLAGFTLGKVAITFLARKNGVSNVSIFKTPIEIGLSALRLKAKRISLFNTIQPTDSLSMRGAGIQYKKNKYITHTSLPKALSAVETFSLNQKLILLAMPLVILVGLMTSALLTMQIIVTILSVLYLIDTLFNLFIVSRSLRKDNEITIAPEELRRIDESKLPMYTVLCPLYKEAYIVPQFLDAIAKMDWPKDKLDVMFLLEEDDKETIEAFGNFTLPYYARTVVVPHSFPKTKPKACNYGLSFAKGEYLVIYDAEDIPDPLQLKKAYLAFQSAPKEVQCLQAKLNFYNPDQNLLTRFFTAEYSLWFDLTLPGIQSLRSIIPLGGTSNHFRTQILRELQGWDPFNVTEDADLGMRLFQRGYQTAIIDSTTMEEATSSVKNWLRQRSRWLKGYMQTYLVHMRNIGEFTKEKGIVHNMIFQLTVGGKILFILLNPLLWIMTLLYFAAYPWVGPALEAIYVPPVSYIAVTSWIFGNFLFLYYYMIGTAKRSQWSITKYALLIPAYWFLMSMAATVAFWQLLFKPHYWEKTTHGAHLAKPNEGVSRVPQVSRVPRVEPVLWVPQVVEVPRVSPRQTRLMQVSRVEAAYKPGFAQILFSLSNTLMSAVAFRNLTGKARGTRGTRDTRGTQSVARGTQVVALGTFSLPTLSRFLPILILMALDALGVVFLFDPSQAYAYLLMSSVAKIGLFLSEFVFNKQKKASTRKNSSLQLIANNIQSLVGLLEFNSQKNTRLRPSDGLQRGKVNILIFNWRDTKHAYAGGAEVYVHELAKRWVADGSKVTLFSGNDNNSLSNEIVDGVEVIRRGGTYTVYLFAFIYYFLKFRGKYDVILDCENGIPFFTPLFARIPVVLLIHHVHQEIFRSVLRFPLKNIAAFLEGKLMPLVYKNNSIVTVSESSRKEIFTLGFADAGNISIITNGVSPELSVAYPKTVHPSFVYLGRLAGYKNIDVAIKAFADVLRTYPTAILSIVGSGEKDQALEELVKKLRIEKSVAFFGRVSEKDKARLLAESWVALQPSSMEGWGITVIEANAAGTPVIASRVNGLQDSVVHNLTGLLVENGNIKEFAHAMKSMIADPTLRTMLTQNALRWSYHFDWDKSASDLYNLLGKDSGMEYGKTYGELYVAAK